MAKTFVRYINSLTIEIVIAVIAFIYQYRREGASVKPVYLGEASYGTPRRGTSSRYLLATATKFDGLLRLSKFDRKPRANTLHDPPSENSPFHVFARFEISNLSRWARIIFINLLLCDACRPWREVILKRASNTISNNSRDCWRVVQFLALKRGVAIQRKGACMI